VRKVNHDTVISSLLEGVAPRKENIVSALTLSPMRMIQVSLGLPPAGAPNKLPVLPEMRFNSTTNSLLGTCDSYLPVLVFPKENP
jgi:hypothetical protein